MYNNFKLSLIFCLVITTFPTCADESSNLDDSHNVKTLPANEQNGTQFIIDLGWNSEYISEGRNNLDSGGITWGTIAAQYGNLNIYVIGGRADDQDYTEWNYGLEYAITLSNTVEMSLGYQRLEFYGDERSSDNELFSTLTYHYQNWLVPSLAYTYSTEADGYFVEVSIHSPWQVNQEFSVTAYITQAFDFKYVTEEHNGVNNFQFGVEAEYLINDRLTLSGHFSHSIAQEDIKLESKALGDESNLDQTYAGIHLTWSL
ncbi:MAG: hypothetical protein V5788_08540 [Shewanella sp.]